MNLEAEYQSVLDASHKSRDFKLRSLELKVFREVVTSLENIDEEYCQRHTNELWRILMVSTRFSSVHFLDYLIEKMKLLGFSWEDLADLLFVAMIHSRLDMVKYFVEEKGVNVLHRDFSYYSDLSDGLRRDSIEISSLLEFLIVNCKSLILVKYLLDSLSYKISRCGGIVEQCFDHGAPVSLLKYLIEEHDCPINETSANDYSLLQSCVIGRDFEKFKCLMEMGCHRGESIFHSGSLLHLAACYGNSELGLSVNSSELMNEEMSFKFLKYMLEEAAYDVNELSSGFTMSQVTVSHMIAYNGSIDLLKYLMSKGADLTICSLEGETILHSAVCSENIEMMRFVVGLGIIDINALLTEEMEETALDILLEIIIDEKDKSQMISLFRKHGAKLAVEL